MEKIISTSYGGANSKVGELLVNRLLPNRYVDAVGPFVFLDHLYPANIKPAIPKAPNGEFAHPHRGIATFSYLFSGALEHFDSYGHHGIVEAGGAQWMKAGNGVIHDEHNSPAFQEKGGLLHGLQFWINLPAENKAELPDYLAVQAADIPEVHLPDEAGKLRVVIGSFGDHFSPVKTYSPQFLYHLKLNAKSTFVLRAKPGMEYAALVPDEAVKINDESFAKSEFISFGADGEDIILSNPGITVADVIIFGGEYYAEPIVAEGPFVMNTRQEIGEAYRDFHLGKYGTIDYNKTSILK
ncbi:pirin family protein [Ferruginibacter sp. HRS2-29]|uniref:pirin family protein n=1 Tax=Ferruginibacter sp. HRS2-29 TaxID=2487334 RepID=UPI0020CCA2CA|nr:pirin family protein [Ferruginibacter sp. HRS2-29]MCP9749798.1 pirin family protein [Ferruginibacter sp. HRS2-29]